MTYDVLILENGEYREYSKNNQAPTPLSAICFARLYLYYACPLITCKDKHTIIQIKFKLRFCQKSINRPWQ
jgi:hypothetical protein